MLRTILFAFAACSACLAATRSPAETATVAVASNFVTALDAISEAFQSATSHELIVTAGSTGQLYAQIANGAPFDVFLAGDAQRPQLLAAAELGEPGTRFTYASGRLVLWSANASAFPELGLEILESDRFRWIAIANPRLAPYGAAAREVLHNLGLWESLQDRIVVGQNVAQAFAMTETRGADLGLVALSQALSYRRSASYFVVPESLHEPIRQDAILLSRARENPAAKAFISFLETRPAKDIIEAHGYRAHGLDHP
jgi:molybdate transport system substrate-binding protein